MEQSQEQVKTYDAKIEENASKPEYAKKVERYQTLRGAKDGHRDDDCRRGLGYAPVWDSAAVHGVDRLSFQNSKLS